MNKDQYKKDQLIRRLVFTIFGSKLFSFPLTFRYRIKMYQKFFNIGKNPIIEHNVILSRTHGLEGTIQIGEHVLLARNSFIDYSGFVKIKDNVKIAADVIIESHHRDIDLYQRNNEDKNIPTSLIIEKNAYIGVKATILSSCNYIGKNARIGAGAVVTKDVPDNSTVVGVPAEIVRVRDH